MRTYYLHGKITPDAFHLKATLNKMPPKGYYLITEQIAESIHQAVRITVEQCALNPPKGKEITFDIPKGAQASFIRKNLND